MTTLAGDVLRDTKAVLRAEFELARAELKQDAKTLIHFVVATTAAIILLHVSLLALATAVVLWFDGSVGALFIVGLALLGTGAAALFVAKKQMKELDK